MQARADSIDEFVTATIAELVHRPREHVQRRTSLADIGCDSLAITTLATFVAEEYGCKFTAEQLTTLYSATLVDDVLLAVRREVCSDADGAVSTAPREEQAF